MKINKKNIAVIGSGFSGLAAASVLAKEGNKVTIFEKNEQVGGRARAFNEKGYLFDMGPSWYWMPNVFENYFSLFNRQSKDYYSLTQLDPGFVIYFGKNDKMVVPASINGIYDLFENTENGAAEKLKLFLTEAKIKYDVAFKNFIYKPSNTAFEFVDINTLKLLFKLDIFNSFYKHVRKFFKNERLIQLMEFPILFLGGAPNNIPGLYSLMNYSALEQGTWYPFGGFSKISDGMADLAKELGVVIKTEEPVNKMIVVNNQITSIVTSKNQYLFDAVVSSSDYVHSEQLLEKKYRNYDEKYWDKKVMSPSSLIFYVGVSKKIKNLDHHNLFFDESLDQHSKEIYDLPQWPSKPLFYVCCPSKTDATVAPEGHENLFILMPIASGISDNEDIREKYYTLIINRLEHIIGETIKDNIDYKKSYCITDFKSDYNSYKGNAYGLANTLTQTAFLKPKLKNKKISNLYYAGQLTVPGPGVPPAIISGQIAANELLKKLQ